MTAEEKDMPFLGNCKGCQKVRGIASRGLCRRCLGKAEIRERFHVPGPTLIDTPPLPATKPCLQCGQTITRQGRSAARWILQRFCSAPCMASYRRAKSETAGDLPDERVHTARQPWCLWCKAPVAALMTLCAACQAQYAKAAATLPVLESTEERA